MLAVVVASLKLVVGAAVVASRSVSLLPLSLGLFCLTDSSTGLLRLGNSSFAVTESELGLPNRLFVGASCFNGLLKRLLVETGLLRSLKMLVELNVCFCSSEILDFVADWLEVAKRLVVLGAGVCVPNKLVVGTGLCSRLLNKLLDGAEPVLRPPNMLLGGPGC